MASAVTIPSGIDYASFMALRDNERAFQYDDRDSMLYALAAGMGRDPLNERELRFVYEGAGFVAMPTLAVVVARSMLARTLPIDFTKVLHGEQFLTLHRPLPTAAALVTDTRLTKIVDKGAGKGAVIYHETAARLAKTGEPLFTLAASLFARANGGFGGSPDTAPVPHAIPDREPDHTVVTPTRPDQALLYRLTGDRNPLHADPEAARRAGFPKPILHGLCTYAIACRAIMATVCDYDPSRMVAFDVRFTSPVLPGDRIHTEIWVDNDVISFRCQVPDRNVTAVNNGRCLVR